MTGSHGHVLGKCFPLRLSFSEDGLLCGRPDLGYDVLCPDEAAGGLVVEQGKQIVPLFLIPLLEGGRINAGF